MTYLQCNGANDETLLLSINKGNKWQHICRNEITVVIRAVVCAAGPAIGFTEADISMHSLRAGGAITLLMVRVDPDTI